MKAILIPVLFGCSCANAAVVMVAGESFKQAQLTIDDKFGGVIGDKIDLAPGEHRIEFDGLHAYQFSVRLQVTENGAVTVAAAGATRFDDCVNNRIERFQLQPWPKPEVTGAAGGVIVSLSPPQYQDRGDQGECRSDSSMLPLKRLGVVKVSAASVPTGADIWVAGKVVGKTDSELVVPYTNGDRQSVRFVLKKPGFANCLRTIATPATGDATASVECRLEPAW